MKIKFIDNLADDKKDHVVAGQAMASFITPVALMILAFFYSQLTINELTKAMFYGATVVFVIGTLINAFKELIYDLILGKGTPEWKDFLATEIPLLTSYLPYLIINIITNN
tara:strand:- start:3183 stop:3515 length:333 start_codon:yes stop_codon:yes gene_type:complete